MTPRKIRIRPVSRVTIRVSEKPSYVCRDCNNRYHSLFYFCPQCLGLLVPTLRRPATLKIVAVEPSKVQDLAGLLRVLSGKKDFDFEKVFRSLPYTLIGETDISVLQHWEDVLQAYGAEIEITQQQAKRRRAARPLFSSDAPLPFFFPAPLDQDVRNIARLIQNTSLRLQWVEVVETTFRTLEGSYKHHPDQRILFSDLLYRMEQELQTAVQDFQSYYRTREGEFAKVIRRLRSRLKKTQLEMEAVRRQVEEQL